MSVVRKTLILALIATFGVGLGACANTMRGAGQDVENAGEAVQDAAS
jgi:predicted small secreted protein